MARPGSLLYFDVVGDSRELEHYSLSLPVQLVAKSLLDAMTEFDAGFFDW